MKILAISHLPREKFSSRLHMDLIRALRGYKGCKLLVLPGDYLQEQGMTAESVYRNYTPDIVILYDSHAPNGKETRFSSTFFSNFPCKTVMIEVDFWKKAGSGEAGRKKSWGDLSWYITNKFDLVIRRGCYLGTDRIGNIPSVWLPFAASDEFYPSTEPRDSTIGFAGAISGGGSMINGVAVYSQRKLALRKLSEAGLLSLRRKWRNSKPSSKEQYPLFLRSVRAALTSAETRSIHGKAFEIMASGAVLLTPKFDYSQTLFGNSPCYVEYAEDCSDVVEKAKEILRDKARAALVARSAVDVINSRHRTHHRISELYEHLENTLQNKPIINRWER